MRRRGQKRWKLEEDEAQEWDAITFRAYSQPLVMVNFFRYLGRNLIETGNDWTVVVEKYRG